VAVGSHRQFLSGKMMSGEKEIFSDVKWRPGRCGA
jgi:hypothetical protein